MDLQNHPSGSYTWRINNYSSLTQKKYYSDVFTVGGCQWTILIFPKGVKLDHFAIYLAVPDAATLPTGWSREAYFTLTMINQNDGSFSTRKAEVDVLAVVPPVVVPEAAPRPVPYMATSVVNSHQVAETNNQPNAVPSVVAVNARPVMETNHFDSFFTELEEFIVITENKEGSSSNNDSNIQMCDMMSGSPSSEEVEEAKQSLKECLSDLFKLNMKDRLAAALSTLTRAEVGLSCDQQRSIRAFWDNFDDFISDFLMFEQDNSEFELQKLTRDQMFSAMKKNHEAHLSNKQLLEAITEEEEEIGKRLEEVNSRKEKLISDWESLMTKSEEMKSKYTSQEKKLAEAEEKKRIAEERMSRSAAAWSSLKAQFLVMPPFSDA
ncbi:hypothetical protein CRG98_036734 [Punica granatum]|uniref:MATH domain-containing protein n=1 Tax=Punica granatum TaxID=22663 RepID=A0A2I0IHZ5_PUNGR|nr:hypothetical protein CRG98_036734 [Punica granatum]